MVASLRLIHSHCVVSLIKTLYQLLSTGLIPAVSEKDMKSS